MERVTATLDEETLAKIRHVAGPRGVSSFLNEAARERLARLELRGLLDGLGAQHGAAAAALRRSSVAPSAPESGYAGSSSTTGRSACPRRSSWRAPRATELATRRSI